jgi:hypothetical protein
MKRKRIREVRVSNTGIVRFVRDDGSEGRYAPSYPAFGRLSALTYEPGYRTVMVAPFTTKPAVIIKPTN